MSPVCPKHLSLPAMHAVCETFLTCLWLIHSVTVFRMICTEWLTSSWWTSTRTSGSRPLLPCQGHARHTAVSPPGELIASPTGTRDFSLFSKRTEPHLTGPEHSRQGVTGETTQPKMGRGTHWGLGGGSFCTLSVPLLFSLVANWRLLIVGDFGIGLSQRLWPQPPHRKRTEHKQGP